MHLICPPPPPPPQTKNKKVCITFVFHFSWVLQSSEEKLKTMLAQNSGRQIRCIMGDVEVASGNPNGTRGFWGEIAWPPGLIETKNNNNVESFFDYVLIATLTWITGKELQREIKNKGDEFCWKNNMNILYRW